MLVASSLPREGHDSTLDEGLYQVGDGRENGFPPPQGKCSGPLKCYSDSSRFRNFDFSFLSLYLAKIFIIREEVGIKGKKTHRTKVWHTGLTHHQPLTIREQQQSCAK